MKRLVYFLSALAMAGCQPPSGLFPSGPRAPMVAVELQVPPVAFVGDLVPLRFQASEGPVVIEVTNEEAADQVKRIELPAGTTAYDVKLDGTHLPAFRSEAGLVQVYRLKVTAGNGETGAVLNVVSDRDVEPMPPVMVQMGGNPSTRGPDAWTSAEGTASTDAFVQKFAESWKGQDVTFNSTQIGHSLAQIPANYGPVPETVKIREYVVRGTFPKVLVTSDFSATGRPMAIAPAALRIVVSQTAPARLIRFQVLDE